VLISIKFFEFKQRHGELTILLVENDRFEDDKLSLTRTQRS